MHETYSGGKVVDLGKPEGAESLNDNLSRLLLSAITLIKRNVNYLIIITHIKRYIKK